jgi:hypothetical protein
MSCGRAVRPAEGIRAKESRMKRSNGRAADVVGGKFGGFASIRGDFTVAYGRKMGRDREWQSERV